jgi:putative ABC transport system ATP-binding protein
MAALRTATCTVHRGQRVALVGPSGSGKSTLLHLMAELDRPTTGSVDWPGLPGSPRSMPPGVVAVVFQAPSLIPTLDVVENVALPLVLGGTDSGEARHRAVRALERIGLGELGPRLPDELSGGQAQRVAVARALAGRPRLVLADEPTGQLDRATSAELISALLRVLQPSSALVVATHDPVVANQLDQRWVLDDGRLDSKEPACFR